MRVDSLLATLKSNHTSQNKINGVTVLGQTNNKVNFMRTPRNHGNIWNYERYRPTISFLISLLRVKSFSFLYNFNRSWIDHIFRFYKVLIDFKFTPLNINLFLAFQIKNPNFGEDIIRQRVNWLILVKNSFPWFHD